MGYEAERAQDLADEFATGFLNHDGTPRTSGSMGDFETDGPAGSWTPARNNGECFCGRPYRIGDLMLDDGIPESVYFSCAACVSPDELKTFPAGGQSSVLVAPAPSNFDVAGDEFEAPAPVTAPVPVVDPLRPQAVNGRYPAPRPSDGKRMSWMRVSNLIKKAEDTYHLERWSERNVVAGLVAEPDLYDRAQGLDVKGDKSDLNQIVTEAKEAAGANKASDEGTRLHKSAEIADFADGSLGGVPKNHHTKIALYLGALRDYGLTVLPGMIERFTVSERYNVAGTFDRICAWQSYGNVIVDLKTGDSLDLSFPSISAQLECYQDGVNQGGVFDGQRYDNRGRVRTDVALVIHLPSTRDEVNVYRINLAKGREILSACEHLIQVRKIKAKDVAVKLEPMTDQDVWAEQRNAEFIEMMNAAHSVGELMQIMQYARGRGGWNERLANVARSLAAELTP